MQEGWGAHGRPNQTSGGAHAMLSIGHFCFTLDFGCTTCTWMCCLLGLCKGNTKKIVLLGIKRAC